jgi:hypothetical protein
MGLPALPPSSDWKTWVAGAMRCRDLKPLRGELVQLIEKQIETLAKETCESLTDTELRECRPLSGRPWKQPRPPLERTEVSTETSEPN